MACLCWGVVRNLNWRVSKINDYSSILCLLIEEFNIRNPDVWEIKMSSTCVCVYWHLLDYCRWSKRVTICCVSAEYKVFMQVCLFVHLIQEHASEWSEKHSRPFWTLPEKRCRSYKSQSELLNSYGWGRSFSIITFHLNQDVWIMKFLIHFCFCWH